MTLPKIQPLRPILSKTVPVGREWVYELKLDGFRGMLEIQNTSARFTSKNSHWMRRFDALAMTLRRSLDVRSAILDGEIVAMGKTGPDFRALFYGRGTPCYAAFDLLFVNGRDLRALPLWRRKRALQKLVETTAIGYVDHIENPALHAFVMEHDLEGLVAKRRGDPYSATTQWLKVKWRGYSQWEGRWEMFRPRPARARPATPRASAGPAARW